MNKKIFTVVSLQDFTMASPLIHAIPFQNALSGVSADGSFIESGGDASRLGAEVNANLSGSESYSGINGNGNSATMVLTYNGAAQTTVDGALRSRISASLSDPFYNPGVNGASVPESFSAESSALYADVFNVVGGVGLSQVQFSIDLDGTLSERDLFAESSNVTVWQGGSFDPLSGNSATRLFEGNGLLINNVDELITTGLLPVVGGEVEIFLQLITNVQFNLFQSLSSNVLDGESDFFNTLTIREVSGFDANGNPVDLESITGGNGSQFQTVRVQNPNPNAIPEPTTLALLGLGIAGLGFRKKAA